MAVVAPHDADARRALPGWVVMPDRIVIGNSSPLAPWMVMIRTAWSSVSGSSGSWTRALSAPLQLGPFDERPQVATAGVVERARLVDQEAKPAPHLGGPRVAEGERASPGARASESFEQSRSGASHQRSSHSPSEVGHGAPATGWSTGDRVGWWRGAGSQRPPACVVGEQVDVGAGVQR